MSTRQITRGTCAFCANTYTKSGMSRHLTACKARKAAIAAEEAGGAPTSMLIRLAIDGTYAPDHWLHLEVPADATLYDLDQFLRGIWLECCGHLSMFKIAEQHFMVQILDHWWAEDDRNMNVRLGDVLTPALRFSYRYDFGSSTDLTLKVVSERMGVASRDEPVQILARNDPLDYRCDHCGKPAVWVDVFEDYTLLCRDCDETDGDSEGLMPLVNSPRVGVCGYTGDAW